VRQRLQSFRTSAFLQRTWIVATHQFPSSSRRHPRAGPRRYQCRRETLTPGDREVRSCERGAEASHSRFANDRKQHTRRRGQPRCQTVCLRCPRPPRSATRTHNFSLCPGTQRATCITDVHASVVADGGSNLWTAFATASAPASEKVTSSVTCSPTSSGRPHKLALGSVPRTLGASFKDWFSGGMSKHLHHEITRRGRRRAGPSGTPCAAVASLGLRSPPGRHRRQESMARRETCTAPTGSRRRAPVYKCAGARRPPAPPTCVRTSALRSPGRTRASSSESTARGPSPPRSRQTCSCTTAGTRRRTGSS
jgi:hypothetical protein